MVPHLAILQGTHNVANLQKIMTRIGGVCLITIGIWCVIELGVQFGHYGHSCYLGEGALLPEPKVQLDIAHFNACVHSRNAFDLVFIR